jgi:hypothetical protein
MRSMLATMSAAGCQSESQPSPSLPARRERGRRNTGDPERDRPIRLRIHLEALELVMLALELKIVAEPEVAHDVDHLVAAAAAIRELATEHLELVARPADADRRHDTIAGERRQCRQRLRNREGIAHGQHERVRREAQLRRDRAIAAIVTN